MIFGVCIYNRLLGDKSPFSQQNLQGDALDRDEETARIQCKSFFFFVLKIKILLVDTLASKLYL